MSETSIEWTQRVWNPVRGCSVVSAGCTHCYAMRVAHRFSGPGQPYEGLTRARKKLGPVWTGGVRFVPSKLDEPLRWRTSTRIFVNSMSDLFHEGVTDEQIAAVFGVMAAAPQHTFQVLTKRPGRARAWFKWIEWPPYEDPIERLSTIAGANGTWTWPDELPAWPLPNVWIGVSVEDQATANERIPVLLDCPAAVRWVSYEPALGPVNFSAWVDESGWDSLLETCTSCKAYPPSLDWIVVGGESGPGARPFDLAWALSTIEQCQAAGVPCFVKQLGAEPFSSHDGLADALPHPLYGRTFLDRKGGKPDEWPEELRVREYPRREERE